MLSTLSNRLFKISLIGSLLFFNLSSVFSQEISPRKEEKITLLQSGTTAPINVLKDLSGEECPFPLLGKWNIVFYWSLFCHSCIEEMPEIQAKMSKMKGKDFNSYFVSLDTEKMEKALKNFVKRRKFSNTILMEKIENEKYITADTWGVTMTPSVFITNPKGTIVFSHQGPLDLEVFFKNLPKELIDNKVVEKEIEYE